MAWRPRERLSASILKPARPRRHTRFGGQHLNWYIVEQLPVVPPKRFESVRFGKRTAAEIVREAVLELTYTAHNMIERPQGTG